LVFFCR